MLITLPRKISPNHIRQEKRERAEQRLRFKMGSVFIQLCLTIKSDSKVMERKVPPKIRLTVNPL